jgi:hypothetical protein
MNPSPTSSSRTANTTNEKRGKLIAQSSSNLPRQSGGPSHRQMSADLLRPDRSDAPQVRNPPKQPKSLDYGDCPREWRAVQECLDGITGLDVQETRITATSRLDKLDENALPRFDKAITILMEANRLRAACTLMLMCKSSALLELCSRHIEELKASGC